MGASTSIAQEYHKIQEYWREIDKRPSWRLAIWVAQYQDIDIIDKFLEVERSPLGSTEDLFFRFDTEYKGDFQAYEKGLWEEYLDWFAPAEDPSVDILLALRNDGLLTEEYHPQRPEEYTVSSLWQEMLRFKSCIKDMQDTHFCIYIPPTQPGNDPLTNWFEATLHEGVPEGIRLVTIDYAAKRKVKLRASSQVVLIKPKLNMQEALRNEMDKSSSSYNTVSVEDRYRKQIRLVMDTTLKKSKSALQKEIRKLISISGEMGTVSATISTLLIASQACFSINDDQRCEDYADSALEKADKAMAENDPAGYPVWKSVILLKTAILLKKKKRREAIALYEQMAEKAASQGDVFYAMEGYRMSGYIYYELGEMNRAFETLLLSLAAGSYMEMNLRRQSTFLMAAALALHTGKKIRNAEDIVIVEQQLEEWLGDDWRDLVETEEMEKVRIRRKSSILS